MIVYLRCISCLTSSVAFHHQQQAKMIFYDFYRLILFSGIIHWYLSKFQSPNFIETSNYYLTFQEETIEFEGWSIVYIIKESTPFL